MLPPGLQSTYKTYKEDTKTIATWLAISAKQCGYSADLLDREGSVSSTKAVQASTRLKGKARKNAQKASSGAASSSANPVSEAKPSSITTYIIKVKEFITLAEYIVGCTKPLIKVPSTLVKALDRAIVLRKNIGSTAKAGDASDEGHAYFLGILEKTREVLKPRSPSELVGDRLTEPAHPTKDTGAKQPEEVLNLFEALDLQEPTQEFLDAADVIKAAVTEEERRTTYEVEPVRSKEEEYLAAHCLMEDVRRIRGFLCALWTNYQQGMDLIAVSITVNTAIDFVRTLEQDLVRRFPSKKDYLSIVYLFYGVQCLHQGQDPSHRQRPDDLFNMAVYDLLEDVMMPTYSTLSSLQDVIQSGSVPQYKPGHFGVRDTTTFWSAKSSREKITDDRLVLLEAFPDLMLLSMMTEKSPLAEDELIRGLRHMSPGRDIPFWLVFAMQCLLDAQHELKGAIGNGHDQLRASANSIRASIEQTMKFHESLRIVNWPKQNDMQFTEMLRVITDWIGRDAIADRWKKVQGTRFLQDTGSFRLLRQYPVICGLFSFALKMRYQEIQIVFVNAWGSVMYAGHLYNAVRQEKLVPKAWKDMELAISLQGHDKFFVGDAPSGLEEYLKRFLLSVGYSAAILSPNRRLNSNVVSPNGPRCLIELCAVGKLFAGRYCNNDVAVSWTKASMKPIIEAKLDDESDVEKNDNSTANKINGDKAAKVKQSSSGALLRKPNRNGQAIETTDFLLDIANALHAESMEMTIDYLRIHRFCWKLLRAVNGACKPRLLRTYGGGYLEQENQLPFVVGYIFMAATITSRIAGVLIPRREGVEVSSQLLMTAAGAINEMIELGAGGIEAKLLGK